MPAHKPTAYQTAQQYIRWGRGSLRGLRPATLQRDTDHQMGEITKQNPAVDFFPDPQKAKMWTDVHGAIEKGRRSNAGVAVHFLLDPLSTLIREGRADRDRQLKDVSRTAPRALEGVSADGACVLAIFRVIRTAQLAGMPVAQLQAAYESALQRKTPDSLTDLELIEGLADGNQLAKTEQERGAAKSLRSLVENVRALRVDLDAPDWNEVEREANTLKARASVLAVQPVNPLQQPKLFDAFQSKLAEIEAAGALDDSESLEEFRAQQAATA